MNKIVTASFDKNKLDVGLIRIEKATRDTFALSLQARATKVDVVPMSISAMTVDLVGPGGTFGRLDLPAFKMGFFSGDIRVHNQVIQILDMRAFQAFVSAIMQDEDLVLRLESRRATVKAIGLTATLPYKKELHLKGLANLRSTLIHAKEIGSDVIRSTFCVSNPSPFEIDLGTVMYRALNENGDVIGEQKGETFLMRGGESYFILEGHIAKPMSHGEAVFVAIDVEGDSWVKQIIGLVDIKATIPNGFKVWHV
ncbi:hypothetical protein NLG97_g1444 [Lecanicillium saksenae]|uniref:Uncharacterized protein n=1 Tax=Lecanicillium saksenae TaxID=468837 RepID=A0ACC1R763_9HYPO|nr:hypothetical protein NLG97_g1444 [Lecanicillium saksenae]